MSPIGLLTSQPENREEKMCGIVGYIGKEEDPGLGLELLKKLEYRGYDSAGMAVFDSRREKIECLRAVGRISNLERKFGEGPPQGGTGLYHTRWATHGEVTEANAHPHFGCEKNIFLVHNGIVENYEELKEQLEREGHRFSSETDTEVLAHLVEKFFRGSLEKALRKALPLVKGTYGLAVISERDRGKIVVARNSSPVLIGVGEGENLVASDAAALVPRTKRVIYLEDGEMAVLRPETVLTLDLDLNEKEKMVREIEWDIEEARKSGYPHFMLKEIFETPEAVRNAVRGRVSPEDGKVRLGGLEEMGEEVNGIKRLILSACGTSYYACLAGEYMLEELAGLPVECAYAPEFRYRDQPLKPGTAFVAVSQSGETADTLGALGKAKKAGLLTLGIVNVVGSSIARETEAGVYLHAGPEIGVASTKAFVSQLTVFALLSLFFGERKGLKRERRVRLAEELEDLPRKIEKVLEKKERIKELAGKYKDYDNFLYIGRKYNFPLALEGALKLKEISYLHAEGYEAAEMKHGPIALIDQDFPTFALCPRDSVYERTLSNLEEIKARKGPVIGLVTEGEQRVAALADDTLGVPETEEPLSPILNVVPLQLFAYYVGTLKGYDVDHPRNLAKAVTVE